jgi:hypothetical protein
MRLNHTVGEITGSWTEYGEWVYFISLFGEPSEHEPWGWQIDGHHLIINCFVLGDQVVITPLFMGSEPVLALDGKYAGTRVFEVEETRGMALMRALTPRQRDLARSIFRKLAEAEAAAEGEAPAEPGQGEGGGEDS